MRIYEGDPFQSTQSVREEPFVAPRRATASLRAAVEGFLKSGCTD